MEMKLNLELGEYQLIELRRMAAEARTDVAGIVTGIVKLYLAGKGGKAPVTPAQQRLVNNICAAVDEYRGSGARATKVTASTRRIGRPPLMSQDQVEFARAERARQRSFAEIGAELELGEWVVRRTLERGA